MEIMKKTKTDFGKNTWSLQRCVPSYNIITSVNLRLERRLGGVTAGAVQSAGPGRRRWRPGGDS